MDLAGDGFVILTLRFSPLSGLEATPFFSGDFSSCLSCGYNHIIQPLITFFRSSLRIVLLFKIMK